MAGIVLGQSSFEFGPCATLQDIQEQLIEFQEALGGVAGPAGKDGELVLQPVYIFDDPVDGPILVSPPTDGSDPGDINNYVTDITVEGGSGGGGVDFTADDGLTLTGTSLTTDNDATSYLEYTGTGVTAQNALRWDHIPDYDQGTNAEQLLGQSGGQGEGDDGQPWGMIWRDQEQWLETVTGFNASSRQALVNQSGVVAWGNIGLIGRVTTAITAASGTGTPSFTSGSGQMRVYVPNSSGSTWTESSPAVLLTILNMSGHSVAVGNFIQVKLVSGFWMLDVVNC